MLEEMGPDWHHIREHGYLQLEARAVAIDVLQLLAERGWIQGRTVHTTVWGQIDPTDLDDDAGRYHEIRWTMEALMWSGEAILKRGRDE